MNDNIQKLCKDLLHYDDMIFGWEDTVTRVAEAIVKECAKIAVAIPCPIEEGISRQTQGHTWDMACVAAATKIKEHFGVKP